MNDPTEKPAFQAAAEERLEGQIRLAKRGYHFSDIYLDEHKQHEEAHRKFLFQMEDMGYKPSTENPPFSGIILGTIASTIFWGIIFAVWLFLFS